MEDSSTGTFVALIFTVPFALFVLVWNWAWITSNVGRALGHMAPMWQSHAALLDARYDAQGFVESIVYAGGEGERGNRKFWVRRWLHGRGMLWQMPGCSDEKTLALVEGVVVVPTEDKRLIGVDVETGALLWEMRLSDYVKEGPRWKGPCLLYLLKDGSWLLVAPRAGTVTHSGQLPHAGAEEALFEETAPTSRIEHHGSIGDNGMWGRDELYVPLPESGGTGRLARDNRTYQQLALTVSVCRDHPSGTWDDDADADPSSRDPERVAYSVRKKEPPELAWSEELTPVEGDSVSVDFVHWFAHACAFSLQYVKIPGERKSGSVSVLWLVDFQQRKVLMQIGERIGSWVLDANGRSSIKL